jgi:hypothetical protein
MWWKLLLLVAYVAAYVSVTDNPEHKKSEKAVKFMVRKKR